MTNRKSSTMTTDTKKQRRDNKRPRLKLNREQTASLMNLLADGYFKPGVTIDHLVRLLGWIKVIIPVPADRPAS